MIHIRFIRLSSFSKIKRSIIFLLFGAVGAVLLLLFLIVREIHSKYFASRLILGSVVLLWSVAFAVAFTPFDMPYGWILLITTDYDTLHSVNSSIWVIFSHTNVHLRFVRPSILLRQKKLIVGHK
uniref:Uncharacterized protein n=1 Tax=Trichobilharzia regenti TaxID=157069 RepID=A0AA85J2W7_TRIRE|nr:unnamed protein product [Trichobilharzia regenti]